MWFFGQTFTEPFNGNKLVILSNFYYSCMKFRYSRCHNVKFITRITYIRIYVIYICQTIQSITVGLIQLGVSKSFNNYLVTSTMSTQVWKIKPQISS